MSKWNHNICSSCWENKNPGIKPYSLTEKPEKICCFCGEKTKSGIMVRESPDNLVCKGEHE